MSEQMTLKDCWPHLKSQIGDYWSRKTPRIERLLQHYSPSLRHTHLSVRRQGGEFQASCILTLPTGTLVARGACRTAHESLDKVADQLVKEIRRHTEHIRPESRRRQRHGREDARREHAEVA